MNILITHLSLDLDSFGGVERATHNLAHGIKAQGSEPHVLTGRTQSQSSKNLGDTLGINFRYLDWLMVPAFGKNYDNRIRQQFQNKSKEITREVNSEIVRNQIEYVLCVDQLWGMLPFTKKSDFPISVRFGVIFHIDYGDDDISRAIDFGFDDYFFVSQVVQKSICARHTIEPYAQKILPNCTLLEAGHPLCPTDRFNGPYIFVNGRVAPEKGTLEVISAFAKIAKSTELNLVLCSGSYKFGNNAEFVQMIKDRVRLLGVRDRVYFLHSLKWYEVDELTSNAHLVVLPSHYESFGMAALEAMRVGVPIVAARAENVRTLAADVAFFFEPKNDDDCAAKISNCLSEINSGDIVTRVQLGLQRSTSFGAEQVASDFLSHISVMKKY